MLKSTAAIANLKAAVETLSLPGDRALNRMPVGSCRPDELALEFDDAFRVVSSRSLLHKSDLELISRIDTLLSEMSESEDKSDWTEAADLASASWRKIRETASDALQACSWDAV